jgi:hypothetical protein
VLRTVLVFPSSQLEMSETAVLILSVVEVLFVVACAYAAARRRAPTNVLIVI